MYSRYRKYWRCKQGEILEIGAVKIQNSKEIGRFQSFVKVKEIPENITELTGITYEMVENAPSLTKVLSDFRLFKRQYFCST